MQIADYLGQYANTLASAASSASAKTTGAGVQNLVSTMSEFQEGTVFEGSINSIDGTKVLLGLGNGQTISARLDGSVNLLLGQSVFFQVKSNDGNTIAIKPYAGGAAFNPTIQKALDAAGMEMTKDTIDMVNRMMEEGMPIDKSALLAMRHTLMSNPQVSMSSAIAMSRLGIPVSEQMAAQFENYQNDRHMVLHQMEQVIDELPQAYAKMAASSGASQLELMEFNRQILTILGEGREGRGLLFTDEGAAVLEASQEAGQTGETSLQQAVSGSETAGQAQEASMNNPENSGRLSADTQNMETQDLFVNERQMNLSEDITGNSGNIQQKDGTQDMPRQITELLSRQQIGELEAQLKEVFPQAKDLKLNTQQSAMDLLEAIARQLEESPHSQDKEALAKLFSGKAYHALLKETAEEQWTIKPQDLKQEHKVEDLYQRLDRQMAQMEQLAKHTGMNSSQLSQSAAQVRNNIDFMNQINQTYTYVQIPLKMANQNAHSELYVYTNKRNLRNKEGELSAFLHLDLENLGSTDVSIKMLDKNVSTKFYLADDSAYDLVEKHLPRLEERLAKLGYNCRITVENREEHVDFVEDFLQKGQPAKAASRGMVHRYSFDVRA